jgi:hypothetical protein
MDKLNTTGMLRMLIVCSVFFLVACKSGGAGAETAAQEMADTTTNTDNEASANLPTDPIKEFGLVKAAEDAGYPFMVLTIEFPERQFEENFQLNLEEFPDLDPGKMAAAVGKYASFEYISLVENALLEVKYNGKPLLKMDGVNLAELNKIQGILSGAEFETTGDLPGMLYIKTEEEYVESFPFFVTPELVAANGKQVVGYFEQRVQNTILSFEIKED